MGLKLGMAEVETCGAGIWEKKNSGPSGEVGGMVDWVSVEGGGKVGGVRVEGDMPLVVRCDDLTKQ